MRMYYVQVNLKLPDVSEFDLFLIESLIKHHTIYVYNRYSVKISHFVNCRIYENISLPSFIPGLLKISIIDIGDWRMLCHGGCSAPCGSLTAIPGWTHYTSVAPKPCSPHVVINKKVPRHSEMSENPRHSWLSTTDLWGC